MKKLFFSIIVMAFLVAACFPKFLVTETKKVSSFEECVAAGNPVMESYPRQCRSQSGELFVEVVGDMPTADGKRYVNNDPNQCKLMFFGCEADEQVFFDQNGCGCQKKIETLPDQTGDDIACIQLYDPVCGQVDVQCIKAPCPPIWQTFSNNCFAAVARAKNIQKGTCEDLGY